MIARVRHVLSRLAEAFWIVPGVLVTIAIVGAVLLVESERNGVVPHAFERSAWLYNGSSTGARTLLGSVASSTISVAGTVFSITIAALSLAAGQMGPRLLRSFTNDRGVQVSLGMFLGTFSYALMVLRTVRDPNEGGFVPHLALSVAILLAFVCVATLIYFIDHMAGRINVDTVVDLVSGDMRDAFARLTLGERPPAAPSPEFWHGAAGVRERRSGYMQQLDTDALADWAARNDTALCLTVRLGGYIFAGAPIALLTSPTDDAERAVTDATSVGSKALSSADLDFAVRQLVEVAVRALSPGINDPMTAMSVVDRLGSALCDLVPRYLPTGVVERDGRTVLVVPSIDYDALADTMLHMIRQNAGGSSAVLNHMLDTLVWVARAERDPDRLATLARHVDLLRDDALRTIASGADRDDAIARCRTFDRVRHGGPLAGLSGPATGSRV